MKTTPAPLVPSSKLPIKINQTIGLLLSSLVWLNSYAGEEKPASPPPVKTEKLATEQKLQSLFVMGGIALQQGDYPLAAIIFREILKQEYSPRVELELARALFLAGEFSASREIFNSALDSGGLPWPVKQKVYLYLQEIDNAVGFVDFSVALVSDDNPTSFTSKKEITILNNTYTVPETQEALGLNYKLLGGIPLSDNLLTQAYATLSVRDFEQSSLDSYTLDTGIRYTPAEKRNVLLSAGVENHWNSQSGNYRYPYVSVKYSPRITDQFSQVIEYSIGRLDFEKADHLDTTLQTVAGKLIVPIGEKSRFLGGLTLTNSHAREKPYSYRSTALSAAVEIPVDSWNVEVGGRYTKADYGDTDPFFNQTRNDKKTVWHINLLNRDIDWKGLTPMLGISFEQGESSIDYFTYDRVMFTAELRSYR
ncbi:surface lipoprotein assembly modifier [Amphritea atlantica]|uniref:surface lipoprotein assembly modifier n=1 Tax=Amphritea atlantica TaxID=355243 RepID=UPI0015874FDC|nr:surface lipoprotein assembly modifier [Amphritea atlantica]